MKDIPISTAILSVVLALIGINFVVHRNDADKQLKSNLSAVDAYDSFFEDCKHLFATSTLIDYTAASTTLSADVAKAHRIHEIAGSGAAKSNQEYIRDALCTKLDKLSKTETRTILTDIAHPTEDKKDCEYDIRGRTCTPSN